MNFNYRYLKKFYTASDEVNLMLINNNYLIITDIERQILIIFQMYNVGSFIGVILACFQPINPRKYLDRFMGQNCSYPYFFSFLINKPMQVE